MCCVRQVVQNVSSGEITVEEVPAPSRGPASLLVATRFSLISAGTERAMLRIGRASLLQKARARPDLVQKIVESAKAEGVGATYRKVRGRLDEPYALGYSLSGVVVEACDDAPAAPGELVACAGVGKASHAEIVSVPRHLCARVPAGVDAADAAYGTVAAIALHGIRLADVSLGDVVAVVGLGLIGQMALQLLRAAGCVALGTDPDPWRVDVAREGGFCASSDPSELQREARRRTDNRGADAVLVTAASKSAAPLATAAGVARDRAVVCIVGDVAIESPRAPLFSKELRLVVSRSYGPGRYDPLYEERGIDYPAGYVRWTEGRNLEEVLRLMSTGQVRPGALTTHTVEVADGARAYDLLASPERSLGILLRYPAYDGDGSRSVRLRTDRGRRAHVREPIRVGVIGAGTFARTVLMPEIAKRGSITAVSTRTGISACASAQRFGAPLATTEPGELLSSDAIDAIVIATRHDLHAEYALAALRAGKHVFVEKPLATDETSLQALAQAASESSAVLMVGFNRRFAPLAVKLRQALGEQGPLLVTYRVNAGRLPQSHWAHDPHEGGGRIVGEVCHFVDLAAFLCGGEPQVVAATGVAGASEPLEDDVAAILRFPDGSIATIVYCALGDPALPKERVEVFGEAGAGVLDDFASLTLHRSGRTEVMGSRRNKGHAQEIGTFLAACRTGQQPWPVEQMVAVTRTTLALHQAVHADVR